MAVDQNLTPPTRETPSYSGIDNEIPAYRAINPYAVLSVLLGILGLLSFTSPYFLTFSVIAVLLGLYADRRIKKDPEIWTGRTLAQIGTTLGVAFGFGAITMTMVTGYLRKQDASRFAAKYADVLKSEKLENAIWYTASPTMREGKSPDEYYKMLKSQPPEKNVLQMQSGAILAIKKEVEDHPGTEIHFTGIETHGLDGISPYATALIEVHTPPEKGEPEKEQTALFLLKQVVHDGKPEWWIDESKFPYQPASYVIESKPVDDGHGHAH
ncbi:DUF4190 domain-containing protein [Singulisphaera rosea]